MSAFRVRNIGLALLVTGSLLGTFIQAEETVDHALGSAWPQWRGPNRDGFVATGESWPDRLDQAALKMLWRVDLAPSYSGPIVTADRVFVTETADAKQEVVRALNRDTGEEIWQARWDGAMTVPFFAWSNGSWIRSTPAFDGLTLYVAGMRDVLVALNADTGEEQWRVDFVEKYDKPLPAFGYVSSPLVTDRHVYVQAGAAVRKLDKATGEQVWATLDDGGGMYGSAFSSPVIATVSGKEQLLVQTREKLAGVDLETGQELWSYVVPAFRGMNILTPTVWNESIFTSSYGGKAWLFRLNHDGGAYELQEAWSDNTQAYMSTPVVIQGHAYLHLRNQRFTCIDLSTGERKWTTEPFGKYWSLVANGDSILSLDEQGVLRLIHATPEKFDLIGEAKVAEADAWAHLAVSGENLYVRELKGATAFRWAPEP